MKQVVQRPIFPVLFGLPQLALPAQSGESLSSPFWETSADRIPRLMPVITGLANLFPSSNCLRHGPTVGVAIHKD